MKAENASILSTGTVFGGEVVLGEVKFAVDGAKGYALRMSGKDAADGAAASHINGSSEPQGRLIQEDPRNLIPTQTKSEMSGSQIKRYTKDMMQNGFDQNYPVDAWRNPNTGRLEIQDGHHRAAAAKKAGLNKIPVLVWE